MNFERICEHMVEKFINKDAKKGNFSAQMEFRKKSNHKAFACAGLSGLPIFRFRN
jgi:hypothetical protein